MAKETVCGAAAAKVKEQGIKIKKGEMPRFVTASLKVDYPAPTPVNTELELKGKIKEIIGRKVLVEVNLFAEAKDLRKRGMSFCSIEDIDNA